MLGVKTDSLVSDIMFLIQNVFCEVSWVWDLRLTLYEARRCYIAKAKRVLVVPINKLTFHHSFYVLYLVAIYDGR
jgi:hypothetical protein